MFTAKDKPKWYQLRWKLSNLFVAIGRSIYPPNPEVLAFRMELMSDLLIHGKAMVDTVLPEPSDEQLKEHDKRFKRILKKAKKDSQ